MPKKRKTSLGRKTAGAKKVNQIRLNEDDQTYSQRPIIPEGYPFKFKRVQFPVKLSFVMTINKSQGQTLKHCGLYLENECFSHGQFYVGVSRVGSQKNLKIYAPENKTVNIVYQEILQD